MEINIFHLRGNQRTSGELSRKEGGKIFGSGSRAPIAVSLLVKNPNASQHGQIYFHDIGDYLSREEKLKKIADFASIAGISDASLWTQIEPDQHGDWLRQRDDDLKQYLVLGDKGGSGEVTIFSSYSSGVKTQRDAWCYNASRSVVADSMARMIAFYNAEAERFSLAHGELPKPQREELVDGFVNSNPEKISWTRALKQDAVKDRRFEFHEECLVPSSYRPFTKQWLYYNRRFNEMVYQMPRVFPDGRHKNLVICVNGVGAQKEFSTLITDHLPDLHMMQTGQCFPLYLYDDLESEQAGATSQGTLFSHEVAAPTSLKRKDAITAEGLAHFQSAYPGESISREDLFYYVYGLLHSPDYRKRFADNLGKELPRIPCVKTATDFWAFSHAGRKLADLHLNYESAEPYSLKIDSGGKKLIDDDYRVDKMRYGKKGKDKDLSTLHYNDRITLSGIPLEAYDYVVNGKPALDWVVERQGVKTDKDSGIVNDANDWAVETMQNPRYPMELFQRVVTVSVETQRVVRELPRLEL